MLKIVRLLIYSPRQEAEGGFIGTFTEHLIQIALGTEL